MTLCFSSDGPGKMRRSSHDSGKAQDLPPPAAAVSPAVNFTFVNQSEDLLSLTTRKITNQQQRHVIRSHVMKSVRQEELARGKKRSIGRIRPKRTDSDKTQSTSSDSDTCQKNEPPLSLRADIQQDPLETLHHAHPGDNESGNLAVVRIHPQSTTTMTYTPGVHEFDPFDTLPCASIPHKPLQSLLEYCFDTLLPLTFPAESNHPRDRLARQGLVLQSKISSPPTFLGFMATAAAHRAIFQGQHRDLAPSDENHDDLITDREYRRIKQEAIVAVRKKVERRERIDHSMVDACFGLISTATVVGNFEEARMHLKSITQLMSMVGITQGSLLWVPLSNIKVSVGLLSRPLLQLPWTRRPLSHEILERISPPSTSKISRLGSEFQNMGELSQQLKALLLVSRDICNFCETSSLGFRGMSSEDTATLREKATELEFDLLAYPYETESFHQQQSTEPQLPALEAVIRLAALGFLSVAPHTIMPASGLGRALTHHQKRAMQQWLDERPAHCGVAEVRAVTWALFIFTQNSLRQLEEDFFSKLLFQFTRDLWFSSWQDIETTLCGFLYIPSIQSTVWNAIWATVNKDPTSARSSLSTTL